MFTSPEVKEFEEEFANYVGARYSVLTNSGTTAILAALVAEGIQQGDRVAAPAFTYVGTCLPLLTVGARPVWIDVGSDAPNMDAAALQDTLSNGLTAAVVALLFGSSRGVDEVINACQRSGTSLIFDCAQFLGDHKVTSKLLEAGICCFSFGESKLLRMGEGGAVATNSRLLAERVRRFRHEGESWLHLDASRVSLDTVSPFDVLGGLASTQPGLNLRPLSYAAALGRVQLKGLPEYLATTSRNAGVLSRTIASSANVVLPTSRSVWWSYPFLVNAPLVRDTVLAALLAEGIPAGVHFPRLLPEHPVFQPEPSRSGQDHFPNASRFAQQHIVLPIYPAIESSTAELIGEVTRGVLVNPAIQSEAAHAAGSEFLRKSRLSDLSSGLYMFLADI